MLNILRLLKRFPTTARLLAVLGTSGRVHGGAGIEATAFEIAEHYTKYEYRIPMRDGVRLFTSVYVPKDASVSYPFLLTRTPYSVAPYGPDHYRVNIAPGDSFLKGGYIFVLQDVRGRWMSEGTFIEATPQRADEHADANVDESTDTYDTVEWLLRHVPGNNGRVGIWGVSYPGFYTSAGIIDSHSAIKAASPQAPVADFYLHDWYHGGAFMLLHEFEFLTGFKSQEGPTLPPKIRFQFDPGTQDSYQFFLKLGPLANASRYFEGKGGYWEASLEHTTYDGYWKARAIWPHLKDIHCAVLTVGGWFDAEDLMGTLRTHEAIGRNNIGIFNGLVMGPWVHGAWARADGRRLGSVDFAANTAEFYREHILFPFFEKYLKDRVDIKLAAAYAFETGTNVWRQYAAWPAPGAGLRTLYFQHDGNLSFEAPTGPAGDNDSYVSDPGRPVPFIGYTAFGLPQEYMVGDQRFAARRPDVLVYATPPLEVDVTLAGPVSARLFVSTTGTDSDWVVKLIDAYPEDRYAANDLVAQPPGGASRHIDDVPPPPTVLAGYQQLVRGEPFRGKFRQSFERPIPFVPGRVERVDFTMPDINHTFRRGHRIMIQVQSSWFPLVDRNPQTFVNIPTAQMGDFQAATQRIYRSRLEPSGVEVSVLPEPASAAESP